MFSLVIILLVQVYVIHNDKRVLYKTNGYSCLFKVMLIELESVKFIHIH